MSCAPARWSDGWCWRVRSLYSPSKHAAMACARWEDGMRIGAGPIVLWALLVAPIASPSCAQTAGEAYPTRPVRIIVPFGAGGPGDLFARRGALQLLDDR